MHMRKLLVAALAASTLGAAAHAQTPEQFYAGKTVDIYVGFSAGGYYDVYARLIARHIGRHIPGQPTVVVKNMEGAGSVRLANWFHAVAPKDGTAFGTIARGVPIDPLFGNPGPQFKDGNGLSYIGSANAEVSVCATRPNSGIKTFEDLLTKELVVGGFGTGTESEQHVKLSNAVLGTKFKLVRGYPGGNDVNLAMDRGEVQGRCGWSWTGIRASEFMNQYRNGQLTVFIQNSMDKHPDIPEVPLIMDKAKTTEQKQMLELVLAPQKMGRPFMAPPGIPADRLAALRKAFNDTMRDPQLLEEANKMGLEISAITGEEMQSIIDAAYKVAPALVQKTADAIK
jgi:tripartite-type tricarboxylate transporter receptor subunit TctC